MNLTADHFPPDLKPVLEAFELSVERYAIIRDVYCLHTPNGCFCLKETGYSPERILFVYRFAQHLLERGFPYIAPLLPTAKKSPCLVHNGENYIVTPWINGFEGSYYNDIHIQEMASTLARFHLAAREFDPPDGCTFKISWGKWPENIRTQCNDFLDIKDEAIDKKEKTAFETTFLKEIHYYLEQGYKALNMLERPTYLEIVDLARNQRLLCHYDIGNRNFIFTPEGGAYIIDLDMARFDNQVKDLAMLIYRTLEKRKWDFSVCSTIVENYSKINLLSPGDLQALGALLLFPQKIWRISTRYQKKYHNWPEKRFVNSLNEFVAQKTARENLLREFGRQYLGCPLI